MGYGESGDVRGVVAVEAFYFFYDFGNECFLGFHEENGFFFVLNFAVPPEEGFDFVYEVYAGDEVAFEEGFSDFFGF